MKVKVLVAQSCLTLCDPAGCSPPGSSVHAILQARTLECVIIHFSGGSSLPRGRTQVSWIEGRFFSVWAIRKIVQRPHANELLIGGSFDSKGALEGLPKSIVHLSQSCSFWGRRKFPDSHHGPTRGQTWVPWTSYLCQPIRRIHTSPDLPNTETQKATEIQTPLKQIATEYWAWKKERRNTEGWVPFKRTYFGHLRSHLPWSVGFLETWASYTTSLGLNFFLLEMKSVIITFH